MKLKSLELQGFKSFPEKTVLNFDRGVTAVVGPNGSGKSNISDAMRWVLGEISSRSIRGTKMEDVIFGGTDNRRPMGFCEVSLTIDNTDPDNRMAIDYDEVTVTRRYYRSGDSEYLINRKPVRLRDITEMFMNTGIGRSGYSIVGQGKAAEIISQKSDERRIIFEEASGIAKYRHKKNESERKLAEVEENLVRIGDIVTELEGRVGPLEKEAEKARKYLDLYEKKKAVDVAVTLFDISDIRSKEQKINSEYEIAKHELEMLDDSLRSIETRQDILYENAQKNKLRTEELSRLIRETNEKKFSFESSGKVFENEIEHIRERRKNLQDQLEENKTALNTANTALENAVSDWNERESSHKTVLALLEKIKQELDSVTTEIEKNETTLDTLDEKLTELKEQKINSQIKLSTLAVSEKGDDEHRLQLQSELSELEQAISDFESRIEKSKNTVSEYENNRSELQKRLDAVNASQAELERKALHLSDKSASTEIDIRTKKARIEALSRMEAQLEGYAHSVRTVMSAKEKGLLSGICAPVSKLLSVNEKHTTAIESALGASMQNIVCETDADAKTAIRYLRDNRFGRATFYPINTVKPNFPKGKETDVRTFRGFVGMANELVDTDSKYRNVIDYLLCKTAVFDNLDNASQMAKAMGYSVRTVTLDGQLINTGGSFTGGSGIRESGMLGRQGQIDKLKNEIAEGEASLEKINSEIEKLNEEKNALQKQADEINEKAALFSSLSLAETTQSKVLSTQLEADNAKKSSLLIALDGIDDAAQKAKKEFSDTQSAIAQCDTDIEKTNAEIALAEQKRKSLTLTQSDTQMSLHRTETENALCEKEIENAKEKVEERKNQCFELQNKIEEAEISISECDADLDKIVKSIAESSENAENLTKQIEEYEKETEKLSLLSAENEKKETALREEKKDIEHKRETVFRSYTKLESARDSIAGAQDKLTAHLMDEYELTYTDACALGFEELTEETRKTAMSTLSDLKSKLKSVGNVNVNAIEEYASVSERYNFLKGQFDDLSESRKDLSDVIFKLEKEMREKFLSVFEKINENFKQVFRELFGGGNAEISLSDPENVLTSGIEINVAPPGKIIKSLSLLSGGEQSFVAIALFFSILKVNPTPFCFLDEIEAALDDVNVLRFAEYCKKYSEKTQFIIITHRRGTMEYADTLYGVTMYERGISKVLSVNVADVEAKLGVKL